MKHTHTRRHTRTHNAHLHHQHHMQRICSRHCRLFSSRIELRKVKPKPMSSSSVGLNNQCVVIKIHEVTDLQIDTTGVRSAHQSSMRCHFRERKQTKIQVTVRKPPPEADPGFVHATETELGVHRGRPVRHRTMQLSASPRPFCTDPGVR